MDATNIFLTKHCDTNDTKKVLIIRNCLGREGAQFIKNHAEQGSCENLIPFAKM